MRTSLVRTCALLALAACSDTKPLRIVVVGNSVAPLGGVLAAEEINAAGGINGRLLELTVVREAERVTPREAIATAESLANDAAVLAVIGHGGSATSLVAAQVYNARKVPQVAPNTSSPRYSEAGPYSFRLVASDEHQAAFIATNIFADSTPHRVAVLYANDDYGRVLNEMLRDAFRRQRISAVHEAPFIAGQGFERDAAQIVRTLATARPDVLVWIGLAPELKAIRPRLREALPKLRVLASDGASFIGEASDFELFKGDLLVAYTDVTADEPRLKALAARFLPLAGRPITDGAVLTYDAVGLLAAAMRSGARSRSAIQRFLADGASSEREYDGVSGMIRLDAKGDARPSYVLIEMSGSGPRLLRR